ncbi:MAG TPA: beta-galactosidase [Tepidisphaeraceae bacterium]|nr:beta-galactosidase [Tepidisphaeraceae bacterium]
MTTNLLAGAEPHTFQIGPQSFLLDGNDFQIHCGEIHFARIPREYWRDRLRRCRAMGLNSVCAYLFWNFHESSPGHYDWSDQHDAAEFCRIAQEEGLWVVLRPGPYTCAEWEMGGLPWWLLKNPDIQLRSVDPRYMAAGQAWIKEVGRVLGPLQVTHGGPILMVQVENEYGSYGNDPQYMTAVRQSLKDAGFTVPLFCCNGPVQLRNGYVPDLFQVVNFGADPAGAFKALRDVQPTGPLMCGEFYPGWFDTWGSPHHRGNTPVYLNDLKYMLDHKASFSIYMAHGGTTFGLWAGADRPFKPDTSSYDYDAPISEAGWSSNEKFRLTRELFTKYLPAGQTLPDNPADNPTTTIAPFELTESAALFDNLPQPISDSSPRNLEAYNQGQGCILYRTTLPAAGATTLTLDAVHDFAWVFLDDQPIGVMDRRAHTFHVSLPAHKSEARLDILVETMGRVNFGHEVHDLKGIVGPVRIDQSPPTAVGGLPDPQPTTWQIYPLPLDASMLSALHFTAHAPPAKHPAFYRGSFTVARPADTFLDLSSWGKGVVWVNGHCLARFWNIGPTQTAYLPGPWLRAGENEILILDLLGPAKPIIAGLDKPILNRLRPDLDFSPTSPYGHLTLTSLQPITTGSFPPGDASQRVLFDHPITGKQFCLEARSSHDGQPFAAIAELDLLDPAGNPIPHTRWSIAFADSEEHAAEDGSASNAIDGQAASYWHTAWSASQPGYPHHMVIDLAHPTAIGGFQYTPRQGASKPGLIKDYAIYIGQSLVHPRDKK